MKLEISTPLKTVNSICIQRSFSPLLYIVYGHLATFIPGTRRGLLIALQSYSHKMTIINMTLYDFYAFKTRSNTPLHRAIIEFEDLETIERLLKGGANIHAKNYDNYKPLDLAIQNDNTQVTLLLIRRGALAGEDLNQLLLTVMEMNNATIFKTIIDHGIKFYPLIDLKHLLVAAILQRQPKVIQHILPHLQFFKPSDRYIPREAVINSGPQCEECLQVLLKWNFIVSPDSNYDEDFVFGAIKNGYLSIVVQLIKNGVDVNMVNSNTGLNILKVACIYKQHEIVEILLKHSACVNETTPTSIGVLIHQEYYKCTYSFLSIEESDYLREITCLHIALFNSDPKMVKLLLENGATIIDDPTLFNITCIAIRINCEEIVCILLDYGVDVNNINSNEESLLDFCILDNYCKDDKYNIAELLLKRGAKKLIRTPHNKFLFEVIENGHHRIAQLFLDYDADVQFVNLNGDTLLHKAIENQFDVGFIETLLKLNLPVNATNNDLRTPLHTACRSHCNNALKTKGYIKTLLSYNANINGVDRHLMTPLHLACYLQKSEIVTVLLENGANPNAKNNKGQTPLHIVSEQQYDYDEGIRWKCIDKSPSIIKLLLKYNADIKAVDVNGWTPFHVACETRNTRAIKVLKTLQTFY